MVSKPDDRTGIQSPLALPTLRVCDLHSPAGRDHTGRTALLADLTNDEDRSRGTAMDGCVQVLVSTIDSSRDRPAARAAIAAAIRDRSDVSASIIGNDPAASRAMAASTVRAAQEGPRARSYFLAGMRATSGPVADLVASDPRTARTVAAATASAYERRAVSAVQHAIPGTQPGEGGAAKRPKR